MSSGWSERAAKTRFAVSRCAHAVIVVYFLSPRLLAPAIHVDAEVTLRVTCAGEARLSHDHVMTLWLQLRIHRSP